MEPIAGSTVPHAKTSNIKSLTQTTSGVGLPTAGDQESISIYYLIPWDSPTKGILIGFRKGESLEPTSALSFSH